MYIHCGKHSKQLMRHLHEVSRTAGHLRVTEGSSCHWFMQLPGNSSCLSKADLMHRGAYRCCVSTAVSVPIGPDARIASMSSVTAN